MAIAHATKSLLKVKQDAPKLDNQDKELNALCKSMEAPRSMKEAFELGYQYEGGESFSDPDGFPRRDNIMETELDMDFFAPKDSSAAGGPRLRAKVRMQLTFLEVYAVIDEDAEVRS